MSSTTGGIREAMLAVLAVAVLALPAPAAFLPLPLDGSQVNNDPANAIDPNQDAGVVDVAGGTLTAGKLQVPWATFEQVDGSSQQIYVRAFKNGAWTTQGFPASLNIDPTKEAEAPSIDFAGASRTTPWVSWYEPNDAFGTPTNIFASRFNAAQNRWLPSGQDRADGGQVPSLNIHTDRTAENPSVAGGATIAGNDPVPWIVWEENDGGASDATAPRQIFVSKGVKQAVSGTPCTGFKPSSANNLNGFCWQQVGLDRLNPGAPVPSTRGDPTLNIDPTRAGVEPDIAFTGANDTVVWVVWYEEDATGITGLRSTDMIFAAKAVADSSADGGFHWVAVGNGTAGQTNVLDTAGAKGWGSCAAGQAAEDACGLNRVASANAENPRVAAGTLTPGNPTVPWVVWQEEIGGGKHAIFVSRLVAGNHFELFNASQPISNTVNDATRPDITFSGNTPYITWQEEISGADVTFIGHFEGGAANPLFKLDTPTGIPGSGFGDVANPQRAAVSSTCTANPTNADGSACQAGAAGTPFFLFTAGSAGAKKLFAQAFAPSDVTTLPATDVAALSATLNGSANPGGAGIFTHFDFGPTTAYGSITVDGRLPVGSIGTPFSDVASGLTEGTTVHFRAVAESDFVSVEGNDQSFTFQPAPPVVTPPVVTILQLPAKVRLKKLGRGRNLSVGLELSAPATVKIEVVNKRGKVLRQTTVDQTSAGNFTVQISLKHLHAGKIRLRVTATDAQGQTSTVEQPFKAVG